MKIAYWSIGWMSGTDGPGNRVVVYMQGCPTKCPWCHSPHSQYAKSPLFVNVELCRYCGRCEEVCENKVHTVTASSHSVDRARCQQCGKCIDACPFSDRNSVNSVLRLPTVSEDVRVLFERIRPQLEIVKECGGITLSGGEALYQKTAALELLKLCKEYKIHTCVETSMLLPSYVYRDASPYVDSWLLGFRQIYLPGAYTLEEIHSACNEVICNIKSGGNPELIARFPVIEGYTDSEEILDVLKAVLKENEINSLEILPCNRHMNFYYELIGEEGGLDVKKCIPNDEKVSFIANYFVQDGFSVVKV